MSRFELTINPTYVPDWGFWEALRELAQNAFDREAMEGELKYQSSISYTTSDQKMIFSNENTEIPKSSLLLGSTSKAGDDKMIGQYGEGYKLALLVLVRNGVRVTIYNGKEVWTPRIIKSRRYKSDLLVIDTAKAKHKLSGLYFELEGITPAVYAEFALKCLRTCYPADFIETPYGNILLGDNFKGKVYCGGLYVQDINDEDCVYGYDIKPEHLQLDRDRRKVDTFNLYWKTSSMFNSLKDVKYKELIWSLMKTEAPDIKYYSSFSSSRQDDLYKDICEDTYQDFIKKHGVLAVPVESEEDAKLIKAKYKNTVPVVLPKEKIVYIGGSSSYQQRMSSEKIDTNVSPSDVVKAFYKKHNSAFTDSMKDDFESLIKMSEHWKTTKFDDLPF